MKRFERGFLAAEMYLLVALAISIFGVLIFGFMLAKMYSRDNHRVSDLKQIVHALALYVDAEGTYPNGCEWSYEPCWKDFLHDYIKTPKDPINRAVDDCETKTGCYVYRYCRLEEGRGFVVSANLEKPKKRPLGNNPLCPLGGPNQYWVTN